MTPYLHISVFLWLPGVSVIIYVSLKEYPPCIYGYPSYQSTANCEPSRRGRIAGRARGKRRPGGYVGCGTVSFPNGSGVKFHVHARFTCNRRDTYKVHGVQSIIEAASFVLLK